MGKSLTKSEIEGTRSKYHKYCPKSKSSNIISCPKEIIKNHLKLKWFNDYFKIIAKKSEKTKKTKYNSKKKNKFKSKNHKCKKKKNTKGKKRKSRDRKTRKKSKRDKDV